MSYNNHKRFALSKADQRSHRVSHLRSCALIVAQLMKAPRLQILSAIDLANLDGDNELPSDEMIEKAIAILDRMREHK